MRNEKFNQKTFSLFEQRKANKRNKLLLEFNTVLYLPIVGRNSKSYQFHVAHASFILIMLSKPSTC